MHLIKRVLSGLLLVYVAFFFFTSGPPENASAATINAASCNRADVLTAINTAQNGDTVFIPAGACTWTSAVTIGSSSSRTKMVKLVGAGTDPSTGTRITAGAGGPSPILNVWLSSSLGGFELSNIRFIQGVNDSDDEDVWGIALMGHADSFSSLFRIHHNVFAQANGGWQNSIIIGGANSYSSPDNGHPYIWGVLDNNTWSGTVSFQAVDVMPRYDIGSNGSNILGNSGNVGHLAWRDWTVADHQGTWMNVILENNIFTANGIIPSQAALDSGTGAAMIVRHNTFINNWMSGHGPDTLGGARGTKWMEIYNNQFITRATSNGGWVMANGYKSGTGVNYNNTYWDGAHRGATNPHNITAGGVQFTNGVSVMLTYRRAAASYGAPPCQAVAAGDETNSTCDNNNNTSDPGKGWIAWDMTGAKRGPNASGRTLGYTFSTEPVVYWNNKWADTATLVLPALYGDDPPSASQVGQYLQERREYIIDNSCIGHMTESICSTFWDATTNSKKGYTAYVYPHPLVSGSPTPPPPPPPGPTPTPTPTPVPPPPPGAKFVIGDRIITVQDTATRANPTTSSPNLGTHVIGEFGTITGGPVTADGFTWWQINYDTGVDGWSGHETRFDKASGTPLPGDINLDHIVNSIDYSILNSQWFTSNSQSDLNSDGIVNAIDFSILNNNWFKTW